MFQGIGRIEATKSSQKTTHFHYTFSLLLHADEFDKLP
jgi:hypothetical protein